MKIHYKYLEHERMEDAPFIGALLCANDCTFNCKNCFNQSLKNEDTLISTAEEIINEIKLNPINQGIILGGLEWSLQPEEMLEVIKEASKNNLKIMIYTGCELIEFYKRVDKQELYDSIKTECYIKTGLYDYNNLSINNIRYGVKLASDNQKITKLEVINNVKDY